MWLDNVRKIEEEAIRIETFALVALVVMMLVLASYNVLYRNVLVPWQKSLATSGPPVVVVETPVVTPTASKEDAKDKPDDEGFGGGFGGGFGDDDEEADDSGGFGGGFGDDDEEAKPTPAKPEADDAGGFGGGFGDDEEETKPAAKDQEAGGFGGGFGDDDTDDSEDDDGGFGGGFGSDDDDDDGGFGGGFGSDDKADSKAASPKPKVTPPPAKASPPPGGPPPEGSFGAWVVETVDAIKIEWIDIVLRQLVIIVGFLGAMLATRRKKHINIDAVSKLLPDHARRYTMLLVNLLSMFACVVLASAGLDLVELSLEYPKELVSWAEEWVFQLMFPIGFGLLALHFVVRILEDIHRIQTRGPLPLQGEAAEAAEAAAKNATAQPAAQGGDA